MKVFLFLPFFVVVVYSKSVPEVPSQEWELFKAKYNKIYETEAEDNLRMKIFMEQKEEIEKHNAEYERGEVTYRMAINKFSDLLHSEFVERFTGCKTTRTNEVSKESLYVPPPDAEVPDFMNWTAKGAVTPVKDQGQCGSCWAFSSTGALEGQNFLKNGTLVSLSEQNLVDCSESFGNLGCFGGDMELAFKYVAANKGIDTEDSYPYEGVDDDCRFNASTVGATCTGFKYIKKGDEDALKSAVANIGPISIGIFASDKFLKYCGGVFADDSCSGESINHGVLLVGYGTDEETKKDYWLVKNSWGANWGEGGYIKMLRGVNLCHIADYAVFPLV